MANVTYEGTNVLKYDIKDPSEPLGSNENDRFCKSINGEAPDEVELWDRNDPGPEACCDPPVMTSAKKPLKVDGQLQVDGRVENPVGIFNPDFGVSSKKPIVVTPAEVDTDMSIPSEDQLDVENKAAFWIGEPDQAIPLKMTAISAPDQPDEVLLIPAHRIRRKSNRKAGVWDAGTY